MDVGVRELRDHLSRYLDRVRRGEQLTVTDRGRAVAHIVPVGADRMLDRLVAEGVVTPAPRGGARHRPAPIAATGTVSDLVTDQRR